MHFSTTFTTAAVVALVNGAALTSRATSGEATFYEGNVSGGTCSFVGYSIPSGVYGVALTDSSWDNAKACGGCIEVTGPKGNKITAMVVDQCPGCGSGHLDLFPDAFAKLEDPIKGVIPVSWNYVACPITSPIKLKNKEGTSPYWFSMQVSNANKRVEKLEFSSNGGSRWTGTERKYYNYFEYMPGSGSSSVDVKITSVDGDVVIVKGVGIGSGVTATAGGNFGAGGSSSQSTESQAPAQPQDPAPAAANPVVEVKPVAVSDPGPRPVAETTRAIFQESSAVFEPAQPTTMATTTAKPATAAITSSPIPVTTSSAPLTKSTSAKDVTVTVTVTGCADPTSTPSHHKRSVLAEFKHLLHL